MDKSDQMVLVMGATGQQGGATARHLRARGWTVRALVRDPSSPAARALAKAGVELVAGDMDDRASLDRACAGVHRVFSVQPSSLSSGAGPAFDEVRLGKNVADAAHAAGVRHFVYSSVGGAERASGISFFETKWEIEQHLRALALPATILRPVQFMDTLATPLFGVDRGALALCTPKDAAWQLIAADDIGALAAQVFERPEEHLGEALEIAGDALSGAAIADALGRAVGRAIPCVELPDEVVRGHADLLRLREFLTARGGWRADVPALRRRHPALSTLRQWLAQEGRARLEALLRAEA